MNVSPGALFEAVLQAAVTGLVGTIELGLLDNAGGVTQALSADDIIETPAGSGIYVAARTAPNLAGQYTLLWSLDGTTDPDQVRIEELRVTSSRAAVGLPGDRDLCELADVLRYVPGYESEPDTDETLQSLITSESRELHKHREFRPIPGLDVRRFAIDRTATRLQTIRIGDCAEVDAVELQDAAGTASSTVALDRVLLLPLVRQEWEPIRQLQLIDRVAAAGRYLQVTGTWGFPFVPEDLREATAKRVILRYLSDVAAAGTAFADALNDQTVNLGALFRSAQETLDWYLDLPVD